MELEIKDIQKISVGGERFLDITFYVLDGKEKLQRRLSFPITYTKEEVESELKKYVENLENEKKQAVKQAEIDKQDKNADNVIRELKGKKL